MFRIAPAAFLAAVTLASPAPAWTARNGLDVEPTGRPGEVVVEYDPRLIDTDFWAAAGDYVIRAMGMPASTRLYRSATPRRRGQGYFFTINKDDGTPTSGISSFGKDRDNSSISAGHAQGAFFRPLLFDLRF
ncbi:MAG: hypothetical protein ACOY4T_12565 [Pseudomonadota bacterium]